MSKSKYLILGVFLIVANQADPVAALICKPHVLKAPTPPRWYYVKEVKQEGVSLPDNSIQNTWKYNISWKPVRNDKTFEVLKSYKLVTNACARHTYACTDARCNAEITGCFQSASWVGIAADYLSVAGIRFGTIWKPGVCE